MADAIIKIKVRRDTQANWYSANPILLSGEIGFIADAFYYVIGNGSDNFATLSLNPYNLYSSQGYLEDFVGQAIYQQSLIRIAAEQQLQGNIDAEANLRSIADTNLQTVLQNNINNEALIRESADTILQLNIDAEVTNRENADNTLQSNIDAKQDEIVATSSADYFDGNKTMQPKIGLPISTAQQTAFDLINEFPLNRLGGRYHTPMLLASALSPASTVLNNIYLIQFNVTKTTTITDIAINVTTFGAACLGTWGIYDSNSSGEPNNLLCTSGSLNIASNGVKNVTLGTPIVLTKGSYWTAVWTSVTCSITGNATTTGGAMLNTLGMAAVSTTQVTSFIKGLTYGTGVLPNPFGAYTNSAAVSPLVYFKIT